MTHTLAAYGLPHKGAANSNTDKITGFCLIQKKFLSKNTSI